MGSHIYTIDIPGAADIFILPTNKWNSFDAKVQRIRRMKTRVSPVPKSLNWIPSAINYIDDVQDLLTVSLTLAKPLLRRLPARFVPYLGWVLLANDVLNISTLILGTAVGGTTPKRIGRETADFMQAIRTRGLRRVEPFLNETNWLGFALQAAQVSLNLTGYGLRLGGIFGAISDTFWGTIRALGGAKVIIRTPPPSDPLGKAIRVLSQSHVGTYLKDVWDQDEWKEIAAANNLAIGIIEEEVIRRQKRTQQAIGEQAVVFNSSFVTRKIKKREARLAKTQVPVYKPWNRLTKFALSDIGPYPGIHATDISEDLYTGNTFLDVAQKGVELTTEVDAIHNTLFARSGQGPYTQAMQSQAGATIWELMHGSTGIMHHQFYRYQNIFYRAIENGVFPPPNVPNFRQKKWAQRAYRLGKAKGLDWPDKTDLIQAAIETMDGWDSR